MEMPTDFVNCSVLLVIDGYTQVFSGTAIIAFTPNSSQKFVF